MILLWGMERTHLAHLPPWRIMKKNSPKGDSSALIVYLFIKHLGHPRDTSKPCRVIVWLGVCRGGGNTQETQRKEEEKCSRQREQQVRMLCAK